MSRLAQFARGVRVLDLSSFLPGPFASLMLADMGAEVLKIEPPDGDAMRRLGPCDDRGQPVLHAAVNAGKTVRRMDLKRPEVRAEFLRLVEGTDVLIEGFRPGVMQRLGLDWPTLHAVNPRLVMCSLSGYGASGPRTRDAGHDANYLANSGMMHRNGGSYYDPPVADLSGSLYGVVAILGALRARDADGRGCRIDIGLADTPMALQLFPIAEYGMTGTVAQARGSYLNGGAAYYQVYASRDGRQVALGAIEAKFWAAFCRAADRPDWIARQEDDLPQTGLIAEVGALLGTLTAEECARRFEAADCCFSVVLDLAEALDSPHHRERGLVRSTGQGILQALFPAYVDGAPPMTRSNPSGVGLDFVPK